MLIKPTTRVVPFDMDGNHLAVHCGDPELNSTEAVFAAYPAAAGITLTPKGGLQRIVRRAQAEAEAERAQHWADIEQARRIRERDRAQAADAVDHHGRMEP